MALHKALAKFILQQQKPCGKRTLVRSIKLELIKLIIPKTKVDPNKINKTFYTRKLPHYQPLFRTFFITFCLKDAIPKGHLSKLYDEYKDRLKETDQIEDETVKFELTTELKFQYLITVDQILEKIQTGHHFLKNKEVARVVADSIKKYDNIYYNLICYTIMSNHVHMLIDTSIQEEQIKSGQLAKPAYLDEILRLIKGASSYLANKILNRNGQFWERESFDTIIHSDKYFNNSQAYVLNNPVKANLVTNWMDYEYTYHYKK